MDRGARAEHAATLDGPYPRLYQPLTFGLKLASWAFELDRSRALLRAAATDLAMQIPPGGHDEPPRRRQAAALARLGLAADAASTQTVERDRHDRVPRHRHHRRVHQRFAVETNLQHTEDRGGGRTLQARPDGLVGHAPQAQDLILAERSTGMARGLPRATPGWHAGDQALWHERRPFSGPARPGRPRCCTTDAEQASAWR